METKKNVMLVYGTRPEAIKMAPLVHEFQGDERFNTIVAVTGQHREMLDQVNDIFGITPDYDLDIASPGQGLNAIFAKTLNGLEELFEKVDVDAVVVQGDTTTSTAAAVAAFNQQKPVIHVEAGLRSGNLFSPFPEEANRKITSQLASLHLAPTSTSRDNLVREALPAEDIVVTGNSVIDALFEVVDKKVPFADERLTELASSGRKVLLVTTHRRENLGDAMIGIGKAIGRLADAYPEMTIVVPMHKNPKVRDAIQPGFEGRSNVLDIEPLDYGEFVHLLSLSHIVVTDSGGVQEEAPSLGKPVLVLRENTERPEAVVAGTVKLIGTDEERIVSEVTELMENPSSYALLANAVNPYGDGKASERSVAATAKLLGVGERMEDFDYQALSEVR